MFVLWALIIWMIVLFYKLKKSAGLINIPYLLWVTFASFLNLAYFLLN
ncbi:MAG: tryptophan-rich sensory protein [Bacteroidota bacterium]